MARKNGNQLTIDHHDALIYVMVLVAAVDRRMSDRELKMIGSITGSLPVFADFDRERLVKVAQDCAAVVDQENGVEAVLDMVQAALPQHLRETAYALACDVSATDKRIGPEEMRFLDIIRRRLGVGRLAGAAIERGARARFMTL